MIHFYFDTLANNYEGLSCTCTVLNKNVFQSEVSMCD